MHRVKPLKSRRTNKRNAARTQHAARRAGNAPLREVGYQLPPEIMNAATSDGYSPEAFGRELAQAIEAAKRRQRWIKVAERAAAIGLVAGLAAALWWSL